MTLHVYWSATNEARTYPNVTQQDVNKTITLLSALKDNQGVDFDVRVVVSA